MPAWLKINVDDHIDDAAVVCLHLVRSFPGVDGHVRVLDRDTDEVTPAAYPGRRIGVALGRLREQHTSKHPYPACRAIAGVWNHLGGVPGIPRPPSAPALERVIDANSPIDDRFLHRCDLSDRWTSYESVTGRRFDQQWSHRDSQVRNGQKSEPW